MTKIKKSLALMLVLVLAFSIIGCQGDVENGGKDELTSTVIVGEGRGKNGPVKLEVTFENSEIKDIKVLEHEESSYT
ncbi:MAG: FMN-binding protein, partial [Clostridiales bacterium]|nr:FMN-binding protein [Clostridiales bacterium]